MHCDGMIYIAISDHMSGSGKSGGFFLGESPTEKIAVGYL